MEVSGAVLRQFPFSSAAVLPLPSGEPSFSGQPAGRRNVVSMRPKGVLAGGVNGFSDEGHLQYYLPPLRSGGKKEEKKRAKLVKGLFKDLSAFYSIGFGVETGQETMGKMTKEAAELLLSQLKQLRAEEKEVKRRKKQEKKAMKNARRQNCRGDDSSSSSSSSESGDSKCETVVEMSNLRVEPKPAIRVVPPDCSQALLPLEEIKTEEIEEKHKTPIHGCCGGGSSVAVAMDKIEVCMGGKCKKSGATELLAEFERRVGMEGAVVGCKCMGKCRDGPNVRVVNLRNAEDPVKPHRTPLCIGVGLEDVSTIISNFFEDSKGVDLMAA